VLLVSLLASVHNLMKCFAAILRFECFSFLFKSYALCNIVQAEATVCVGLFSLRARDQKGVLAVALAFSRTHVRMSRLRPIPKPCHFSRLDAAKYLSLQHALAKSCPLDSYAVLFRSMSSSLSTTLRLCLRLHDCLPLCLEFALCFLDARLHSFDLTSDVAQPTFDRHFRVFV
jgi:hypothetical protein